MRIIDIPTPGGPEALIVAERPIPDPADDEVLIRVAAAGVNRADVLQRRGVYPPPPGAPTHPGLEVSGTVAALGPRASEFRVGEPVCALLQGGGYAEYCLAPQGQVLPVPRGIALLDAAALPEAYFTVFSNLYLFGGLQAGESLLVHGGSSGIGVTAIQLARALGATVYATAGSPDKCRRCEALGATRAIPYRELDFVAEIRRLTDGRGVDVILDMVAGEYIPRDLDALAEGGRIVVIATQGGATATVNLVKLMVKRAVLTGSTLRPRSVAFKREVKAHLLERVWPLLAAGKLSVVVDSTFPLESAAAAHRRMESSEHVGKILLTLPTSSSAAGA